MRKSCKDHPFRIFLLFSLILLLSSGGVKGQLFESFETGLPTSYTTETEFTLSSGVWTGSASGVIRGTTGVNSGSYSCQLRSLTGAQITTPPLTGGVGTISFYVTGSTASGGLQIRTSTDNGETWTQVSGSPISFGTETTFVSFEVDNINVDKVQFYRTGATVYIDDVNITEAVTSSYYFVDFESSSSTFESGETGYNPGLYTLNGILWQIGPEALIGSLAGDIKNGLSAARLRNNGSITMDQSKQDGIGYISFYYSRSDFSGDRTGLAPSFVVEYSNDNGTSWTQAGQETNLEGVNELTNFTANVYEEGDLRIRIRQVGGGTDKRWNVDDIRITNFSAGNTTWTGGANTSNWHTQENWSEGEPDFLTNAILENEVVVSAPAQVRNLTINSSGSLIIESGATLEIFGELVNEGNILIKANATGQGYLKHNTPDVEASVEYYSPGGGVWPDEEDPEKGRSTAWQYMSASVLDQNINAFVTGLTYDLYRWDEASDLWRNHKATGFVHTVFEKGVGYLFATPTNVTPAFSGQLIVGDIVWTNLTKQGNESTEYQPGWHLLGNPYTSPIVFRTSGEGVWTGTDVFLTPQKYTGGESYGPYLAGEIIPPATAFFVQANVDGANLTIPASARAFEADPVTKQLHQRIVLKASPLQGSTWQRSIIRIEPDAQQPLDLRYHSRFRPGLAPQFYSVSGEDRWLVNVINQIDDEMSIPFAFRKNEEGNGFVISLEEILADTPLYLVDHKEGKEHKLELDKPYVFTAEETDALLRFSLRFAPLDEATSIAGAAAMNTARIFSHARTLILEFDELVSGRELQVYDVGGRLLLRESLTDAPVIRRNLDLRPGVYLIRVKEAGAVHTGRIILL